MLLWTRKSFTAAATSVLLFTPPPAEQQPSSSIVTTAFQTLLTERLDADPTLAGPLLRLAFHDAVTIDCNDNECMGGPNGSIRYEIAERSENRGLSRPLSVVQDIRRQLPTAPDKDDDDDDDNIDNNNNNNNNNNTTIGLSLADAIALGGALAVEHAGGPHIPIQCGRVDADTPDPARLHQPLLMTSGSPTRNTRSRVETTLPSAALDSDGLRLFFGRLGLRPAEWVALSGSHSLGRHVSLLGMPSTCLKNLTRTCLEDAPVLLPFVTASVDRFDNAYFSALLQWYNRNVTLGEVAFIPTDVALVVDPDLRKHVERFANDQDEYFQVFARAYQKLVRF